MMKFGVSQPVTRVEDRRFLTGEGRYVDDIAPEGAAYAFFLRSPHGHAEIVSLDADAARNSPGVLAVHTGEDLARDMVNAMKFQVVQNRDGTPGAAPERPILATNRVRHVGEAVAMVIADTLAAARDAAELIEVDYADLPAAYDTAAAQDQPEIHPDVAPKNLAYDWGFGDEAATMAAFEKAAHVVELPLVNNRVIASSLEPRGCFAEWDGERIHLAFSGQGVWGVKADLAEMMDLPPEKVRVTNPDVGGGFGMKAWMYPEYPAAAFAARKLSRPIVWRAERSEGMATDYMGRDHVTTARAAFDENHKLQSLHIECVSNLGAYNSPLGQFIASEVAKFVMPGVYDVQTAFLNVKGVYTNTTPVDAYRGAGRPESIYTIERLMDASARQLGLSPVELHRKNFIPKDAFPYRTVVGELYDVGDFERVLDRGLKEADWDGFEARRAESAKRGRLRGIGLCYYIESILGDQSESTKIELTEDGANLYVGTQSNGQGHETVFAQILHERTGVPFEKIRFVQGDSDLIAKGGGTGGSRSVTMQGNSINAAADEMISRFRPLAEEELEAAAADIDFEDGAFRIAGTDRSVTLLELGAVARRRGMEELLAIDRENEVPQRSFPNGAHIAEVEVDPETGETRVVKYTVADDLGLLMNPLLAAGQIHGGVVQGIGQALTEHVVYDEDGQLLTATFMDYALPRAVDAPWIPFHAELVPSTANEIGMKGCGEAGTVGALAAVTNAVLDAVEQAGVHHVDMPCTPHRVWSWLQAARMAAE